MSGKRTRTKAIHEKREIVQACAAIRGVLTPVSHPVLFRSLLVEIVRPQPQWTQRSDSIRAFRVLRGDKRRAFALRLQVRLATNRWLTISWRASILSEFPTARLQACPVRAAMRQSIRRQVCAFRRSAQVGSALSCRICHRQDRSLVYHVDHDTPTFAALVQTFLAEARNAIECPGPLTIQYGRNGRRAFPPEANRFARRWREFHQEQAVLRILCRSCNLRRTRPVAG